MHHQPRRRGSHVFKVVVAAASLAAVAAGAATERALSQPMSLAEAVEIAVRQNPAVAKARKDIEAAEGVAIQTRAIVVPKVQLAGDYTAVEPQAVDQPEFRFPGFEFGTDQSWQAQVRVVQSIYEGGRALSALRQARLLRKRSLLNYQTVASDAVLAVQTAYYGVLLAADQIKVQEASVELLQRELADVEKRYRAGTVPRFDVLRAEVELANARPRLIRLRNAHRIAKNQLANLLGFDVPRDAMEDIPVTLTGKLEAVPSGLGLSRALRLALERRTELASLRAGEALRREQLVEAKSGYKPSVQAFAGYGAQSSLFSDELTDEVHGWLAGVQLTWNIFDGLRTQGRIKESRALVERSEIELADAMRTIELEVRTAYSRLVEATELLESQKKVSGQAEEALRLARTRYEAGTGTQLDVLSAQTALTDARSNEVQALHDYAAALARLERATGATVVAE